jgi:hypothetical protein
MAKTREMGDSVSGVDFVFTSGNPRKTPENRAEMALIPLPICDTNIENISWRLSIGSGQFP